jgi:hypothetical protein
MLPARKAAHLLEVRAVRTRSRGAPAVTGGTEIGQQGSRRRVNMAPSPLMGDGTRDRLLPVRDAALVRRIEAKWPRRITGAVYESRVRLCRTRPFVGLQVRPNL